MDEIKNSLLDLHEVLRVVRMVPVLWGNGRHSNQSEYSHELSCCTASTQQCPLLIVVYLKPLLRTEKRQLSAKGESADSSMLGKSPSHVKLM